MKTTTVYKSETAEIVVTDELISPHCEMTSIRTTGCSLVSVIIRSDGSVVVILPDGRAHLTTHNASPALLITG